MGLFSRRRSADAQHSAAAAAAAPTPEGVEADLPEPEIAHLTDDTFMAGTEGAWTIVDFWADWCGPCHQFAPTFSHAARLHTSDSIRFAKLDVEAARQAAGLVGVQSIPTVVVFGPDGSEVARAAGVLPPARLEALIAEVRQAAGVS